MPFIDLDFRNFTLKEHETHIAKIYEGLDKFFPPVVAPQEAPASIAVALAAPAPDIKLAEGQSSSGLSQRQQKKIEAQKEAEEAGYNASVARRVAKEAAIKATATRDQATQASVKATTAQKEADEGAGKPGANDKRKAAASAKKEADEADKLAITSEREAEEAEQKAVAANNVADQATNKVAALAKEEAEEAQKNAAPIIEAVKEEPPVSVPGVARPIALEDSNINELAEYLRYLTTQNKISTHLLMPLFTYKKNDQAPLAVKIQQIVTTNADAEKIFSIWLSFINRMMTESIEQSEKASFITSVLEWLTPLIPLVNENKVQQLFKSLEKIQQARILASPNWYRFLSQPAFNQALVSTQDPTLRIATLNLLCALSRYESPSITFEHCYNLLDQNFDQPQKLGLGLALCTRDTLQLYIELVGILLNNDQITPAQKIGLILLPNFNDEQTLVEGFLESPMLAKDPDAMLSLLNYLTNVINKKFLTPGELFLLLNKEYKEAEKTILDKLFKHACAYSFKNLEIWKALFKLICVMLDQNTDLTKAQIFTILSSQYLREVWSVMYKQKGFATLYNTLQTLLINLVKANKLSASESNELHKHYRLLDLVKDDLSMLFTVESTFNLLETVILHDSRLEAHQVAQLYPIDEITDNMQNFLAKEEYLQIYSLLNKSLVTLVRSNKLSADDAVTLSFAFIRFISDTKQITNVLNSFIAFCRLLPKETNTATPEIATELSKREGADADEWDNAVDRQATRLLENPEDYTMFTMMLAKLVKANILTETECFILAKSYHVFEFKRNKLETSATALAAQVHLALMLQSENHKKASVMPELQTFFAGCNQFSTEAGALLRPEAIIASLLSNSNYSGAADFSDIVHYKKDVTDFILAIKHDGLQHYFLNCALTKDGNRLNALMYTAQQHAEFVEKNAGEYAAWVAKGAVRLFTGTVDVIAPFMGYEGVQRSAPTIERGCLKLLNDRKIAIEKTRAAQRAATSSSSSSEAHRSSIPLRLSDDNGNLRFGHTFKPNGDGGSSSRTPGPGSRVDNSYKP